MRANKNHSLCIKCANSSIEHCQNLSLSHIGNRHSDETRKKMSECRRGHKNSMFGRTGVNYGKTFSEQHKNKISQSLKGRTFSDEHRRKLKENHKGMLNKKHTISAKQKMRLVTIKRIEQHKFNGGQLIPGYNSLSIPILEAKANELGIPDLQHAENGGEFQVCGYFVDGYSPSKNIVIEYYELFHEKQEERDELRKQEIMNHLGCKFIEIKEWRANA